LGVWELALSLHSQKEKRCAFLRGFCRQKFFKSGGNNSKTRVLKTFFENYFAVWFQLHTFALPNENPQPLKGLLREDKNSGAVLFQAVLFDVRFKAVSVVQVHYISNKTFTPVTWGSPFRGLGFSGSLKDWEK